MTTKRTPQSKGSEYDDLPNGVSHPIHKLRESLLGHSSAHVLAKRKKL